jgi:hypothetical protein
MALQFKKYESTEKTVLGTVATLAGKGGKLRFSPRNLADENKRVLVIVVLKDGTSCAIIASKELSKRIRSKEVRLSQLATLNVTEEIAASGEIINVVNMPATGELIEVAVNANVETYEPAATFVPEDLVAF